MSELEKNETKSRFSFKDFIDTIFLPFVLPLVYFVLSFVRMFALHRKDYDGDLLIEKVYYSSMLGQLEGVIVLLYIAYLIPVVTQIILFITHKKKPALIYIESIYALAVFLLALLTILVHLGKSFY